MFIATDVFRLAQPVAMPDTATLNKLYETQSRLSTMMSEKVKLELDKAALLAEVAKLKSEASRYRAERDSYYGHVTELRATLGELMRAFYERVHLAKERYSAVEWLAAPIRARVLWWEEKLSIISQKITALRDSMSVSTKLDGLQKKADCACRCSTIKERCEARICGALMVDNPSLSCTRKLTASRGTPTGVPGLWW